MANGIDHRSFAILPRTIRGAEPETGPDELRAEWVFDAEIESIGTHAAAWGDECMALCDVLMYGA